MILLLVPVVMTSFQRCAILLRQHLVAVVVVAPFLLLSCSLQQLLPVLVVPVSSLALISPFGVFQQRQQQQQQQERRIQQSNRLNAIISNSVSDDDSLSSKIPKNVVVISPPGGIGEVTAVKVAQQGYNVKWLVVTNTGSRNSGSNSNTILGTTTATQQPAAVPVITLSQEIVSNINTMGGTIQIASTDAFDLLQTTTTDNAATINTMSSSSSTSSSSLQAIASWCTVTDVLICTLDGVATTLLQQSQQIKKRQEQQQQQMDDTDRMIEWKNAIYVATQAVSKSMTTTGTKIVALSSSTTTAGMDGNTDDEYEDDNSSISTTTTDKDSNNLLTPFTNLFGNKNNNNNKNIPKSLSDAMMNHQANRLYKLRYGPVVFGTPESSNEFTPFISGPRRTPELCDEYMMRNIRLNPTTTYKKSSGSSNSDSTTRTSRHAMGDAITSLLSIINNNSNNNNNNNNGDWIDSSSTVFDVSVTSLPGMTAISPEEWQNEFQRVVSLLNKKGATSTTGTATGIDGIELFDIEFGTVPDIGRMTDWMATKWAPAILRTYDIAAIRTGPRPVYAKRIASNDQMIGKLEIIWQQLINFDSVIVGRMMIEITNRGMTAIRVMEPTNNNNNNNNNMPLAGEDILVRRLAEAASQAIEKGLATKPTPVIVTTAPSSKVVVSVVSPPKTVTSLQSSVNVVEAESATVATTSIPTTATVSTTATAATTTIVSNESGPRVAGARRSTERIRKKPTSSSPTSPTDDNNSNPGSNSEQ